MPPILRRIGQMKSLLVYTTRDLRPATIVLTRIFVAQDAEKASINGRVEKVGLTAHPPLKLVANLFDSIEKRASVAANNCCCVSRSRLLDRRLEPQLDQ